MSQNIYKQLHDEARRVIRERREREVGKSPVFAMPYGNGSGDTLDPVCEKMVEDSASRVGKWVVRQDDGRLYTAGNPYRVPVFYESWGEAYAVALQITGR